MCVCVYAGMCVYVYSVFKKIKISSQNRTGSVGGTVVLECRSAFLLFPVDCLIALILKSPPSGDTERGSPTHPDTDRADCGFS